MYHSLSSSKVRVFLKNSTFKAEKRDRSERNTCCWLVVEDEAQEEGVDGLSSNASNVNFSSSNVTTCCFAALNTCKSEGHSKLAVGKMKIGVGS